MGDDFGTTPAFLGLNKARLNLIGDALAAPAAESFFDVLNPRDLDVDGLAGEDRNGFDGETGAGTNLKSFRRTGLISGSGFCELA